MTTSVIPVQTYIIQVCNTLTSDPDEPDPVLSSSDDTCKITASALKRFQFLSSKLMAQEPFATHNADTAATQVTRYVTEAAAADDVSVLDFWSSRKTTYSSISKSLEMRAILKLNEPIQR